MDKECIKICNALNRLPSVRTMESCCGHGKNNFRVWFFASNFQAINCIGRLTSHNYSPYPWKFGTNGNDDMWKWRILLDHCDTLGYSKETLFCLEGNKDYENIFKEADELGDYLLKLWENMCRYTFKVEPYYKCASEYDEVTREYLDNDVKDAR